MLSFLHLHCAEQGLQREAGAPSCDPDSVVLYQQKKQFCGPLAGRHSLFSNSAVYCENFWMSLFEMIDIATPHAASFIRGPRFSQNVGFCSGVGA